MPQVVETTVYKIEELEGRARDKARDWYRDNVLNHTDWHEPVFEDFKTICGILGITLREKAGPRLRRSQAGTPSPCIWFSGFWSQGDGASFEGTWEHAAGCGRRIREHAPIDETLHAIADALSAAQKPNFYQLEASIRHEGRYYHKHCMVFDVQRADDARRDPTDGSESAVANAMRNLARWLYRQLEAEYEAMNSDEAVDETAAGNDWLFTADGEHFPH